jgi:hypothetical protein
LKQLFYIQSGTVSEISEQVLCVRIGDRHFSFAITDRSGVHLYRLGYYTAREMNSDVLSEILSIHPDLGASFYEVQVGFDHPGSVLVPIAYYNMDDVSRIMSTMHGTNGNMSVISEPVNEWQLYNVYAVPADLHEWLHRRFPSGKYHHNHSVRIKLPSGEPDRLLLDIQPDEFSVIATRGNKLLLAQTYCYTTPEDVLYYLLKACTQFGLSQHDADLCISGLIEKDSKLFRELHHYFVHAAFREPTWSVEGMEGNEYPAHFFTPLNDLARCVS